MSCNIIKSTDERTKHRKEGDRLQSFSSIPFIGHRLLFEVIMEIRSRHIGNQERPGLLALLSSPFRGAVFLWQSANMFSSFCDDGIHAASIIGYRGLLNYIQLPKFRMFAGRITARCLCESVWNVPFSKVFRNEPSSFSRKTSKSRIVERIVFTYFDVKIQCSLYERYRKYIKI